MCYLNEQIIIRATHRRAMFGKTKQANLSQKLEMFGVIAVPVWYIAQIRKSRGLRLQIGFYRSVVQFFVVVGKLNFIHARGWLAFVYVWNIIMCVFNESARFCVVFQKSA